MNPYTFEQTTSLADAIAAQSEPGGFLLAGGTDLIAQMKAGQRAPTRIVDVKKIPEMIHVGQAPDGGLVGISEQRHEQRAQVFGECQVQHEIQRVAPRLGGKLRHVPALVVAVAGIVHLHDAQLVPLAVE